MSYKKIAVISALTVALVGCAHNTDYLREAQTVPPIVVPPNLSMKPNQNYYPIPNVPVSTVTQPPSTEPPGSHLQRFKKSSKNNQRAQIEV